jgi:DNA-binding transcriptional MerR regulator/methylmalonyl-CoA mutase cobalamin-binding subunit
VTKAARVTGRYPIRAVSQLTSLGIDTLRAWERRYGAVTPIRDDRGRMYTDADVARLRLLRAAVERGHAIGRIAGLGDAELHDLLRPQATPATVSTRETPTCDTGTLSAALYRFDAVGIDEEIARFAAVLRPLDLLEQVLMPVLVQIGEAWHQGRAGIAHEHVMSAAIRHILGSLLRLHVRRDASARLLFGTLAGDRHEIGVLGAALLAASSGLGVVYLGPDLPARELVEGVKRAEAQVLVVGLTKPSPSKPLERELAAIVRDLPPDVELWAGGRGAERHAATIKRRGLVFHDYAAYQQELVRFGGRVT